MNRIVNSKRIASDAPSGVMPPLRLRPEDCPAPNESPSFTPKQRGYRQTAESVGQDIMQS
jgi:hypothetical protein